MKTTVTRVVKFRIDERSLSKEQLESFMRHAGAARAAWNWALGRYTVFFDRQKDYVKNKSFVDAGADPVKAKELRADKKWQDVAYKEAKAYLSTIRPELPQSVSMFNTGREFRAMTHEENSPWSWWIEEDHGVQKISVNYVFDDLNKAISRMYSVTSKKPRKDKKPAGYPHFKNAKLTAPSFAVLSAKETRIVVAGHRVLLPGTLGSVRVFNSTKRLRKMIKEGATTTSKTVRINYRGGKWYVVFTLDYPAKPNTVATKKMKSNGAVGVDQGITQRIALSDGTFVANPRFVRSQDRSLVKIQQEMARRDRKSEAYKKARKRYARLQNRIATSREGFIHKITKDLSTNWDLVAIENLSASNMSGSAKGTVDAPGKNVAQKAGLNRSILDAAFYQFSQKLEYKCARYGSELVKVPAPYTSQMCSECGHVAKENRKSQAEFHCVSCSFTANADTNAALNIKKLALDVGRV